jgi:predicted nucleic-acid-binding protein
MIKRESLDTNVLLRYILGDDPEQCKRAAALIEDPARCFDVADVVFIEIAGVTDVKYGFDNLMTAEAISAAIGLKNINCNENMLRPALELFKAHPKLSFADCCLSVTAQLSGITPLWTFDRKLANQTEAAKMVP